MVQTLSSSLELELLEGRARSYSRDILGDSSANSHWGPEPMPTFPPRLGESHPLDFSSVGSTSFSSSYSPSSFLSFFLRTCFFPLRTLYFLLLPSPLDLSFPPPSPISPPTPSSGPGSCGSPGGLKRALLRRIAALALPVRSGGRNRPGNHGEWTRLQVGVGARGAGKPGASFSYRGPGFGGGLGGPGRVPPAAGAPHFSQR